MTSNWRWLSEPAIIAGHDEQLAEHGGAAGVRDLGLLQSTLARPINRAAHAEVDAADLAVAYAFGIARNHRFVDGNKRTALLAAEAFLLDNGFELMAGDTETLQAMLALAAGETSEDAFAGWVRANTVAIA